MNNLSLRLSLVALFAIAAIGAVGSFYAAPPATPVVMRLQPALGCLLLLLPMVWESFGSVAGMVAATLAGALALWGIGVSSEPALGWSLGAVIAAAIGSHWLWRRHQHLLATQQAELERLEIELTSERLAAAERQQRVAGLQQRGQRYRQLQFVGERLGSTLSLGEIGWVAVEHCFQIIGHSSACLLFLVDQDTQELGLFASRRAAGVAPLREKQGDACEQWVMRHRRMLLIGDADKEYRVKLTSRDRPIRSVMAAPILAGTRLYGVLRLDAGEPNGYTQDDLRVLDILTDLISVAVANASLYAQTQRLAMTDGLTGLLLRRYFLEECERELQRKHASAAHVLAMLMVDIDNFKQYNDTFGHAAGDAVLRHVARTLKELTPAESLVARYGGEEFAVVLLGHSLREAAAVAERIRKQIAATPFEMRRRTTALTVSIGVAVGPADGGDALALIRTADTRLYAAKHAGKNRVWHSSS